MKKILFSLLAVGVCGSLPLIASAAVSGKCSKCHTMHNSQNDSQMNLNRPWLDGSAPNEILLRSDCVGCHSGPFQAGPLALNNDDMVAPRVYVYNAGAGALNDSSYAWLPGGYFDPENNPTENRHNVVDLPTTVSGLDGRPLNANDSLLALYMTNDFAPPGYVQMNSGRPGNSTQWTSQLSCAGTWGCHGRTDYAGNTKDTSMTGIAGHHHGNDSPYRYLRVGDGETPVKGTGIAWSAFTPGSNGPKDNVYFANDSALSGGSADKPTISRLCAECHGNFHADSGTGNVFSGTYGNSNSWLRHPTDLNMTNARKTGRSGTRDQWNTVGTSNMVPVGSHNDSAPGAGNNAYVICLSCHVAHGGGYKDLLRWSYTLMSAGTYDSAAVGTGCFVCHTTKDSGHKGDGQL